MNRKLWGANICKEKRIMGKKYEEYKEKLAKSTKNRKNDLNIKEYKNEGPNRPSYKCLDFGHFFCDFLSNIN